MKLSLGPWGPFLIELTWQWSWFGLSLLGGQPFRGDNGAPWMIAIQLGWLRIFLWFRPLL